MRRATRIVATVTALSFTGVSLAQVTAAPPLSSLQDEAEAKFAWGLLIKLVAPSVFEFFAEWVKKKVAAKYDEDSLRHMAINASAAAIVNLGAYLNSKDIVLAGAQPNAGPGDPGEPLRVDGSGENYQGVNVAVVSVDANGKPLGFHPLAGGFSAGERFKLRVLSTFHAVVVLGNITPTGISRQIYPAKAGYAVSIPAGKEILLPLGQKEWLQFAGDTGNDQLTFTVRDPRSLDPGHAANSRVFRKDEALGSNFLQAAEPERFPVIAESITLEHRASTP